MVEIASVCPLQIMPEIRHRDYSETQLLPYAALWNKAKRKIVIVGVAQPNILQQKFLEFLAQDESVLVLTETTSNLNHPEFFTRIDSLIGPIERSEDSTELFQKLRPDILLSFGGMIVSKRSSLF